MTPYELKIAQLIFQALPTLTIAICAAIVFVRWRDSVKKEQEEKNALIKRVDDNTAAIVGLSKIHLEHHPEDSAKFMKDEFVNQI